MLVLECVRALGSSVGRTGAGHRDNGAGCDGQVLGMHDMLGLEPGGGGAAPKFVANFLAGAASVQGAFEAYRLAVREGRFPAPQHEY
jgi:3-methyl-2-oxobutanoate hydroxymethyltransferase